MGGKWELWYSGVAKSVRSALRFGRCVFESDIYYLLCVDDLP